MNLPDIKILKALVKDAAQEILLKDFGHCEFEYKGDGSVVTPADIEMQNRLESDLKKQWPMFDFLGEEMTESAQKTAISHSEGYWCIDPLDGTSNYTSGIPFFAVSIALIINRQQQLALVYDPSRDEMFTAIKGQGAYLNNDIIDCRHKKNFEGRPIIAEVDLKRLPDGLAKKLVTESLFSSQRNMGSSVLDWCWMAVGRFDIYLHGGQKLWDYAAGSLIFSEAGGRSVALDDDAVFRGDLEVRSVLACYDDQLFDKWYQWIGI